MEDCESPGEKQEVSQGEAMRSQELLEERGACVATGGGSVPSSGRGTVGLGSWSQGSRPETPGPLSEQQTPELGNLCKEEGLLEPCIPTPQPTPHT